MGILGESGKGEGEGRERMGKYQVSDEFICQKDGLVAEFTKVWCSTC